MLTIIFLMWKLWFIHDLLKIYYTHSYFIHTQELSLNGVRKLLTPFHTCIKESVGRGPPFTVHAYVVLCSFHLISHYLLSPYWGFPDSSVGKESACNGEDPSSIPSSGRFAGEGIGYPLQYPPGEFHELYSIWGCKESDT